MRKRIKKCHRCNQKAILMQTFDKVCGEKPMYYVICSNENCKTRTYATDKKSLAIFDWNNEKNIV